MRLMVLTAITLCFTACSGCEEAKVEAPAPTPAPAVAEPAPTPPPAPVIEAAPIRQATPEELKAAAEEGNKQLVDNNPMRRFESHTARLNGKQVTVHPTRKLRPIRGLERAKPVSSSESAPGAR